MHASESKLTAVDQSISVTACRTQLGMLSAGLGTPKHGYRRDWVNRVFGRMGCDAL